MYVVIFHIFMLDNTAYNKSEPPHGDDDGEEALGLSCGLWEEGNYCSKYYENTPVDRVRNKI